MLYLRTRNVELETGLHMALADARLCSGSFFARQEKTFSSALPNIPSMLLLHWCFPFWAQFLKIESIFHEFHRKLKTLHAEETPEGSAHLRQVGRPLDILPERMPALQSESLHLSALLPGTQASAKQKSRAPQGNRCREGRCTVLWGWGGGSGSPNPQILRLCLNAGISIPKDAEKKYAVQPTAFPVFRCSDERFPKLLSALSSHCPSSDLDASPRKYYTGSFVFEEISEFALSAKHHRVCMCRPAFISDLPVRTPRVREDHFLVLCTADSRRICAIRTFGFQAPKSSLCLIVTFLHAQMHTWCNILCWCSAMCFRVILA